MNQNTKLIVGVAAIAAVGVGAYYLYRYASRAQAAALDQRGTQNDISTVTGILDTIGSAGGVTGVLGSFFGGGLGVSRTGSVQSDGSTYDPNYTDYTAG